MITGDIRTQIDRVWQNFWEGGVANPLSVIEQITYLLFIKRLDELQTVEEAQAQGLGQSIENPILPAGKDGLESPQFDQGGYAYEERRRRIFLIEQVRAIVKTLGELEPRVAM